MSQLAITVLGNVSTRRTEAEISWRTQADEECVALVFETSSGWQVEVNNQLRVDALGTEFEAAATNARKRLEEYVNRRGDNIPVGLTAAGLSLWLLEKRDGTAMGVPLRK